MKSSTLVSRVQRILETNGGVGDGAALAETYAEAVEAVNRRLEQADQALANKQYSEAGRVLDEPPALVEEVSTLDFRLAESWRDLCGRRGWRVAAPIDFTRLQRIQASSGDCLSLEPQMRLYRKAVRTGNTELMLQVLRRLVELDSSQEWEGPLRQAELLSRQGILAAFRKARSEENLEQSEALAERYLSDEWSTPPPEADAQLCREVLEARNERERSQTAQEDLAALRRCLSESWELAVAERLSSEVAELVEMGVKLGNEDAEMLATVQARVTQEREAEAKERKWQSLVEQLHAACEREDAPRIREVLASPEFLDREPDELLLTKARQALLYHEVARRHRLTRIAGTVLVGLLALATVTGFWIKNRIAEFRCEQALAELENIPLDLTASPRQLHAYLANLAENDPKVYSDPRVMAYLVKAQNLERETLARTNELASIRKELDRERNENWPSEVEKTESQIKRVEPLCRKDDVSARDWLRNLQTEWMAHKLRLENELKEQGGKAGTALLERLADLQKRYSKERSSAALEGLSKRLENEVSQWREAYATSLPSVNNRITESEKKWTEARTRQKNFESLYTKFLSASTAEELIEARAQLLTHYSGYSVLEPLLANPYPVALEAYKEIAGGTHDFLRRYNEWLPRLPGQDKVKEMWTERVKCLREFPQFTTVYGLHSPDTNTCKAVCLGEPRKDGSQIKGDLLWVAGSEPKRLGRIDTSKVQYAMMPCSRQIRQVVDETAGAASCQDFGTTLSGIIADAVKPFRTPGRVATEAARRYPDTTSITALRQARFLSIYREWLTKDFPLLPDYTFAADRLAAVARFGNPMNLRDSIDPSLDWCCLMEPRVKAANRDAAKILKDLAESDFRVLYAQARRAVASLERIASWKLVYAGRTDVAAPLKPPACWQVKEGVPVYALRLGNGRPVLQRAFVREGGKWLIYPGAKGQLLPGEPLFQIVENGERIDTREVLTVLSKGVKLPLVKGRVPYLDF